LGNSFKGGSLIKLNFGRGSKRGEGRFLRKKGAFFKFGGFKQFLGKGYLRGRNYFSGVKGITWGG